MLFVGNSYLYSQDIPGIVQTLADSAGGDKLAVATTAAPNFALIDHWNEGTARREINKGGWEWVVLQQGPSSTDLNRDTLRLAAGLFAAEIEKVNARPALFSAWPREDRRQDFSRAIESWAICMLLPRESPTSPPARYTLAATDVSGVLLPVAAAWLAAWSRDTTLQLYADGLHPSPEGAYLAALVIYARLLGESPSGLPASLRLRGGRVISIEPGIAATLQAAAVDVIQSATSR